MPKKLIAILLACVLLLLPATAAAAAPFKLDFSVTRPDTGVFCSELTYNNEVIWRIQVLADGAKPVFAGGGDQMTIIIPDISHGLFTVKFNK